MMAGKVDTSAIGNSLADILGPQTIEQSLQRIADAFERIATALETGQVSPAPATPPVKVDSR